MKSFKIRNVLNYQYLNRNYYVSLMKFWQRQLQQQQKQPYIVPISSSSSYSSSLRRQGLISSAFIISSTAMIVWKMNERDVLAASKYSNSEVYSWGFNQYGQLGLGSEDNVPLPTLVEALSHKAITFLSCGAEQTAAITEDGQLYTFGRGQDSRLGHGKSGGVNETTPKLVEELSGQKVVYANAGYMHMAAITQDGTLWTWGKNSYNQLGHSNSDYPNPVLKLKEMGVIAKQVCCGRYHTVVLAEDGSVYAWGGYKSGETGTGHKNNVPEPTRVQLDKKVVQIAVGQQFTLFLTENGDVYSCGANDQGQAGQGAKKERYIVTPTRISNLSKVSRIAAGQAHSIACTKDGDVYTWGSNNDGQLGHGDTQNRTMPDRLVALSATDPNSEWIAIEVAAGHGHSACLCKHKKTGNKQLFLFGRGRQGQIGRANRIESVAQYRAEPVEVDFFQTMQKNCDIEQIVLGANHTAVLCVHP